MPEHLLTLMNQYNLNVFTLFAGLGMLSLFIIRFSLSYYRSRRVNKSLKNLSTYLSKIERNKGRTQETIDSIESKFLEDSTFEHNWKEFSESLVSENDGLVSTYQNTLDANFFFPHESIIRKADLNSILPSVLTGLGILGTFLGIVFGLSSLNLEQLVSSGDDLSGLQNFMQGIATSFYTSIVVLGFSLVYTIYDSTLTKSVDSKLDELIHHLDRIFTKATTEQILTKIHQVSINQLSKLEQMPEKISGGIVSGMAGGFTSGTIGEELKENVQRGFNELSESINKFLKYQEGFELMVNKAQEGLSKTIESVENVNIMCGNTIQSAREVNTSLETSSTNLKEVGNTVNASLEGIRSVNESQELTSRSVKETAESVAEFAKTIEPQVKNLISENEIVTKSFNEATEQFRDDIRNVHDASYTNLNKLHEDVQKNILEILTLINEKSREFSGISTDSKNNLEKSIHSSHILLKKIDSLMSNELKEEAS